MVTNRKILIWSVLVVLIYFVVRLMFFYTLVPNLGLNDKKHKNEGVYYFPTTIFNPLKKAQLIKKIKVYNSTGKLQESNEIWWYNEIDNNNFELISIKKENKDYHILIRHLRENVTIVFVMDKNKIHRFY